VDVGLTFARIAVGVTLLVAGALKLHSGEGRFLQAVVGFQFLPSRIATIVARLIPPIELSCGVLLLLGIAVPVAAIVAFILLFAFTIAIAHSLLRGLDNNCGCFAAMDPVRWRLVYRNVVLMGFALASYAGGAGVFALDGVFVAPIEVPGAVAAVIVGASLALWAATVLAIPFVHWHRSRTTNI